MNNISIHTHTRREREVEHFQSNLVFSHRKLSNNLTINLVDDQISACGFYLQIVRFVNHILLKTESECLLEINCEIPFAKITDLEEVFWKFLVICKIGDCFECVTNILISPNKVI